MWQQNEGLHKIKNICCCEQNACSSLAITYLPD